MNHLQSLLYMLALGVVLFGGNVATASDGQALVKQYQCIACHAINDMEMRIGPPLPAVALRYAKADDATVQRLATKIIEGGAGAWGTVPMVMHPQVSAAEADAMVRWVLTLSPGATSEKKTDRKREGKK